MEIHDSNPCIAFLKQGWAITGGGPGRMLLSDHSVRPRRDHEGKIVFPRLLDSKRGTPGGVSVRRYSGCV